MALQTKDSEPNELTVSTAVADNWPLELRTWFGQLMVDKFQPPPDLSLPVWHVWLNSVHKHGLNSLLFGKLRTADSHIRPPAEVYNILRTAYFDEVAQIMVRRTQLDNLLQKLEKAGIGPLVLKGAALGESIYSDVFQRPTADIDILVTKKDFEAARSVFLENGYRSKRGDRRDQMGWSCDEEFLPAAGDENRQYVVEIHWTLSSHAQLLNKIEAEHLIGRSDSTNGLKHSFQVLNPVDALVFACLHLFYKHITELRLIWLYDIHLLARRIESHGLWYEVITLSQAWQARLALKNCLQLAHEWFESPFPEEVADLNYKPATVDEMQMFNLAIFQLEHGQRHGWLRKHLFQLERLKGWDKYRYLKSRLLPTRQEIVANYPRLHLWPGPFVHLGRFVMMLKSK
jgi:hypothetical protein